MKPAEALRAEAQASGQDSPGSAVSSHAVIASMRQHAIAFTADNYTVWHCYLAGSNIALKRAIDIVLSNGLAVEERALRALHARHFRQAHEALALRDLALRLVQTMAGFAATPACIEADMQVLLEQDLQDMVQRSERLARLRDQWEERIAQLQRFLDDAREEASTDSLTRVATRRAFDAALHRALQARALDGMPASVLPKRYVAYDLVATRLNAAREFYALSPHVAADCDLLLGAVEDILRRHRAGRAKAQGSREHHREPAHEGVAALRRLERVQRAR